MHITFICEIPPLLFLCNYWCTTTAISNLMDHLLLIKDCLFATVVFQKKSQFNLTETIAHTELPCRAMYFDGSYGFNKH